MHFKHKDLNGYMNKWMDACMDRWVNGWLCGRRKSLRKSIKFSGEQLWHLTSSLLLPSTAPLPGAHPINPLLQVHLSVGEMVQESVSWGWQELIDHSQAPVPLGANHSSMGWRLQDGEDPVLSQICMPHRTLLQSCGKGGSQPRCFTVTALSTLPGTQWMLDKSLMSWNEISWSSLNRTNGLCVTDTVPTITSSWKPLLERMTEWVERSITWPSREDINQTSSAFREINPMEWACHLPFVI